MEHETLKIFDENKNEIGAAPRKEVHEKGLWHETFQCWFTSKEKGLDYIYLQNRSSSKKDFPNLLDITAAGHILAHETVYDGIREVKEEIGIEVPYDSLIPLDVLKYSVKTDKIVDNEFANVFLYQSSHSFDDFDLQLEEVSGIVKAKFDDFYKLWLGELEEIIVEGFKIKDDKRVDIRNTVNKHNFVPHEIPYYQKVLSMIQNVIKG